MPRIKNLDPNRWITSRLDVLVGVIKNQPTFDIFLEAILKRPHIKKGNLHHSVAVKVRAGYLSSTQSSDIKPRGVSKSAIAGGYVIFIYLIGVAVGI